MRAISALLLMIVVAVPIRADDRPQWRAVWVDAFNPGIKTPEQIDKLIANVKSLNCNTIVAQVRKRGDSLYRDSLEPFSEDASVPTGFDPLGHLLEKAHAAGLQVHAWVNVGTVWPGSGNPPKDPNHLFNRHGLNATGFDDWLTRDDQGNKKFSSGYFADAGHLTYQHHFALTVVRLVEKYPVDGIHLDFVRYPETDGSLDKGFAAGYNPTSVERFQKTYGIKSSPDRRDPTWNQWRRDQMTHLVRLLRVRLLAEKPKVVLSAALIPWGAGPTTEDDWYKSAPYCRVFQDWHAWRKEGLLDVIIPMNYDRDSLPDQKQYFDQWVDFETKAKYKSQSVVGLGAYMNGPTDTAAQVNRALAKGADGVCFFSYAYLNKPVGEGKGRNIDSLRMQLVRPDAAFATTAAVPAIPRIKQPTEGAICGHSDVDTQTVILEPLGGGTPRRVSVNAHDIIAVDVKPGRYRIAYTLTTRAGDKSRRVDQLDVIAGKVTALFDDSGAIDTPALVPDPISTPPVIPRAIDSIPTGESENRIQSPKDKPGRPITVDDLWAAKRVGPPSLSPDGTWAVVEVTSWDVPKDESFSELWLLKTDGSQKKQLTNSGGKNAGPRWSPSGNQIAFSAKRTGDEVAQIYVVSPDGGEARRVSKMPMAPSSLKWSADGATIYAVAWTWPDCKTDADHLAHEKAQKEAKSKAVVISDATFRYWDHWISDGKRPFVYSVDVASGAHRNMLAGAGRHLPPYEPSANDFDISPDGRELCFVSENVKEMGLDSNHDLFALDLTKPSPLKNLTADNEANDTNPIYSPDGSQLAFLRTTTKFFYADRQRLMVMDRAGGAAREMAAGRPLDRTVTGPRWLPPHDKSEKAAIVADVEDSGYVRLGLFSQSDPVRLLPGKYSDRSPDAARKSSSVAFNRGSFDFPQQVWAGSAGSMKRRIDSFNDELTAQWKLGKVEDVQIDGAGGRKVQMWVVYPPDFDPAKKWPLVQVIHGGPHNGITTDFSYRWNPQLWAAQGWVVGIVNFHGSSGFGQEFTDSITGDLGTKPLEDILKATDWFAAKPWIDSNRMATAGASYGGYMMAWMNGHTDRFKAMVCHAGVYNWHAMTASDLVRGRERSLGAPPWGDLTKIDKQNAQRLAAKFKTPTLVVHGEKDYRVPVTQGFEYYNTLKQKGVPCKLLYFPDENHWVMKPQNSLVWHREVFGWIEKYIGHGPTK